MKVAGIGFRAGAPVSALAEALVLAEAAAGDYGGPVRALATDPVKAGAAVIQALGATRGLPVLSVMVAGVATPMQSPRVQARFGTGSVAEAAAIAAAGTGGRLLCLRVTSSDGMATAAIAVGDRQ